MTVILILGLIALAGSALADFPNCATGPVAHIILLNGTEVANQESSWPTTQSAIQRPILIPEQLL